MTMERKYNFYAGPATLPLPVLEQIRDEIVDYRNEGMSIIETSHRSPMYDRIHNETVGLIRELFGIPEDYHVLFLGGGATLQFAMVPLNLLVSGKSCDMVVSGSWAQKALRDAQKIGTVNVVFDGMDSGYTKLPAQIQPTAGAAYVHITSNETIGGVQWKDFPKTKDVPLVADMSSDILSRPLKVADFGLIYAGAQKNIGPAGLSVVIVRDDIVQEAPDSLPSYLSYKTHAEKNSLYNTPPVFAVYTTNLVLKWLKDRGGVEGIWKTNQQKARLVYRAVERNGGFYRCPVETAVRSVMNVVFRLPTEELESRFIREAAEKGMIGLKGHRSVGGCRASLYNAMPLEGAECLAEFMDDFAKREG
jgi:phosphoserine aminotransferase